MENKKINISTPEFLKDNLEKLDGKHIQWWNKFWKNITKGRYVIDEASQIMNSNEKLDLSIWKIK